MPSLGSIVAELVAKAKASASHAGASLTPVAEFGANPGALHMWVHLPVDQPPNAALVVVLHGCGQTAAGYAAGAGWVELADRHGFALLCPEQARGNNANLCFNWFEDGDVRRGAGEAGSIAAMIRHALHTHDLDPDRVFVTGLSAGGAMAAVMLAAYPELFSGGAVIAGLPYGAASGVDQALAAMRRPPTRTGVEWGDKVRRAAPRPARWPHVSIWHGGADTTVAPAAADALALQWCDVHGADRQSHGGSLAAGHAHTVWRGRDGEIAVELHRMAGLGHGTPIAAGGSDGCGAAAPWILEAGLSSSGEIARAWGLTAVRRPPVSPPRPPPPTAGAMGSRPGRLPGGEVGEVITRALRDAGLMR